MTEHRRLSSPLLRPPPGPWSNAIEIRAGARTVYSAGIVGAHADGTIAEGVAAQTTRIFEIISILLAEAGMQMTDVVKMITYLVDIADQPAYSAARKPFFAGCSPAMTLVGVNQLASPAIRVEVEVIAAKHD